MDDDKKRSLDTEETPDGSGDSENEQEETVGRFARFGKRIFDREYGEDARFVLGTLLESSDRAKSEVVRLVAREVRTYLDELKIKDDLRDLLTGHTLEVSASFSLKEKRRPEESDT